MTLKRDLIPKTGMNFEPLMGRPIYELRLRVEPNLLTAFLDFDSLWFLPVDQATREVLRFIHQTGTHFNVVFIYRYGSWDDFVNFDDVYREAWMAHYHESDPNVAQAAIEDREMELNAMEADSARHLLGEIDGNSWSSPALEVEPVI